MDAWECSQFVQQVKIVVSEVSKVIWIEANSDNVKFEQDLHDDAMKQCTDANFRDRYHWPHSSWTELGAKSPEPVIKSKGNGVPTVSCALSPTGDNANDVSHSDYILNHLFDFPAKTLEVIRPYLEFRYPSLIAKRRVLVLAPIGQEPQLRLDPRLLAKSPSLPSRKRCFGEVEV